MSFHDIATPESLIAIAQASARKMAGRHGGDADRFGKLGGLPPVEFGDLSIRGDFFGHQAGAQAERDSKIRFPLGGDATERGHVEMIVVVVTLQHEVDFGKVLERNTGRAMTLWADPGKRAGAVRPDGVAKNIDGIELNQHGRVSNECRADGATADAVGWDGARRSVNPFAPRTGFAIGEPLN